MHTEDRQIDKDTNKDIDRQSFRQADRDRLERPTGKSVPALI